MTEQEVGQARVINATISVATEANETNATSDKKEENVKIVEDLAKDMQDTLNSFSDEIPSKEAEAKKVVNNFADFIKSDDFKKSINQTASKYKIPPKKLAQNFFEKVLGIAGDVLGISISTIGNIGHTVVNVISSVLHSGIDLICKFANAIANIFTLNHTCIA